MKTSAVELTRAGAHRIDAVLKWSRAAEGLCTVPPHRVRSRLTCPMRQAVAQGALFRISTTETASSSVTGASDLWDETSRGCMDMPWRSVEGRVVCLVALILCFLGSMTTDSMEAIPTCNVNWNAEKQTIDGFGASGAFHQAANLMEYPEKERNLILDLLFTQDKGIGLSIVRNIIGDGGDWGEPIDGPTPSIEPQEGVWNWSGDEDQIWLMNEAKKRGGGLFVSTAWSPPAWMKTNNSVIRGGELRTDKYQAFADYLASYVRGYNEHHDIDIYEISPANEPDLSTDYSSCFWTGSQLRDFIKNYLTPTLKREGVDVRVIIPETMNFDEDYALDTLNDFEAAQGVDIVASHAYDFKARRFPVATSQQKTLWQTEVSNIGFNDGSIDDGLKYARLLHDHLSVTGVNAWFFWWLISYKEGEALIHLDTELKTFTAFKRLYAIGNYSRFVRPGYVRINTDTNPVSNVYVTAYKDKTSGRFAIVAINDGNEEQTIRLGLDEFPGLSGVIPYRTSDAEDLAKLGEIPVSNGAFFATLKARSVTSFVAADHELPGKLGIRSVISQIASESFDEESGVELVPGSEGSSIVVFAEKGAFVAYENCNFDKGTATCDLKVSFSGRGKLELLLVSPVLGTYVGRYSVLTPEEESASGEEAVWETVTIPTEKVRGVHDLYLVFTPWDEGVICKLDWMQFKVEAKPPAGEIKVQMENETESVRTDRITPRFRIVNTGKVPVNLEEVKIRYFYTLDSEAPQELECYGVSIPDSAVVGSLVEMKAVTPQADYYLEMGFDGTAGRLEPGQEVELHAVISTQGPMYLQENDFSFNPDCMVDWEAVPGYVDAKLCWGCEPSLLANPGFENGTTKGWFDFGGLSKITVTNEASHTGAYSVLVTDRTEPWQGVAHDLIPVMKPGATYEISAWIKLKDKMNDVGRISIKRTDDRGDNYSWVGSEAVTDENWTCISGLYTLDVTGMLRELQLYSEGPGPGVDYYVDNVVVREVTGEAVAEN